jgi:alkylation response protein AidB-like acyl-CoA dehydrogenase
MENALATGRLAVEASVVHCADYTFEPGPEALNATAIQKTIAAESLILAVEKALEVAGGGGIYRAAGLERLVRDIHAVRFHPLQAKRQHRYSGRLALGLDPNG